MGAEPDAGARSPFVTFVTPTVGRPSLIATIASLRAQTDDDLEVVVAADRCPHVEPLAATHWVSGEFGSAGGARNAALESLSRGWLPVRPSPMSWVGFVDDDDVVTTTYVETLRTVPPEVGLAVFGMRDANGGLWPKYVDGAAPRSLYDACFGIHFAVRWWWAQRHRFVIEVLNGPDRVSEDITFAQAVHDDGAAVWFVPGVHYLRGGPPS